MIHELKWDSDLFGKKIGILSIDSDSVSKISAIIKKAKGDGFKYIICKLKEQQTPVIRALESSGFYLSDIGITWAIESNQIKYKSSSKNLKKKNLIRIATDKDTPMLKKMITQLFLESRFYNDPFFSKKEADKLYSTWIENSVGGKNADIVYVIPEIGFIVCKKNTEKRGEISLIGIKQDFRGKGFGINLLNAALDWFKSQDVSIVSVRTQLKNLNAMNFYLKSGFFIESYDLIFARIL